ncbi:hypothetical protein [Marinomonas sp. A3A]|uniref:hypothetical protein n=1 Tax=Marinomonas sp. A3A TaxID=2065312 RepID=UPI001BB39590|nr:hypothetical protein [Marinomonas sp. A3A]
MLEFIPRLSLVRSDSVTLAVKAKKPASAGFFISKDWESKSGFLQLWVALFASLVANHL